MQTKLDLGGITIDVVRKDISNVHLSVYPPIGKVRLAAPTRMSLDTIRLFAISKLGWIRRQQKSLREQVRDSRREYLDRESHYVWGRRCLLKLVEGEAAPSVQLRHTNLVLRVRPGSDVRTREAVVSEWYRDQIKAAAATLIEAWAQRLKVTVSGFYVQKMKTKWGSCNPVARTIRLNTELAKKPADCLEYIVLHELVHLRERHHGDRFTALMDAHMPHWRLLRDELNRGPLSHETWLY